MLPTHSPLSEAPTVVHESFVQRAEPKVYTKPQAALAVAGAMVGVMLLATVVVLIYGTGKYIPMFVTYGTTNSMLATMYGPTAALLALIIGVTTVGRALRKRSPHEQTRVLTRNLACGIVSLVIFGGLAALMLA